MYYKIITTTDNKKIANKISKKIIELKYSPCVQINSIDSIYRWEENIKKSKEYNLTIKTIDKNVKKVVNIIESLHNYNIPEIITSNISIENSDYKKWFLENSK